MYSLMMKSISISDPVSIKAICHVNSCQEKGEVTFVAMDGFVNSFKAGNCQREDLEV